MKREVFITVIALAHAGYFLLSGLWPLLDMDSFEKVTGARQGHGSVRGLSGVLISIGAALIWSVHRGLVDPPMRVVLAGASGTLGLLSIISAMHKQGDLFYLLDGCIHMVFAIGWVGILLTAGSPYTPRPIVKAKRLRESAQEGEDPGWWK